MLTKKHILFLVPDGVGIKNYLYSNIISHLKNDCEITIWSPLPRGAFDNVKELHNIDFGYKNITFSPENIKTRLYREAATYARLKHNSLLENNPTILTNWRSPSYSLKVKILYKCAEVFGHFFNKNYQKILNLEEKSRNSISKALISQYVEDLEALNPTSIFITHQRVAGLMPICLAAKQLSIKTTTAIFSWDNLPKARLSVKTDDYLVWSEWMKDEMKTYYPEVSEENVKLVGTPQFEFYLDENRITLRKEFAKQYGLDLYKKWICFSGDDFITSPHDELFLRDVVQSLHDMKDTVQVIFRRCPVDFSSRYDNTLNKYKDFVIAIDPIWNVESETGWVGYFPKYDDINLQVNLVYHCCMVLNLGSTMAHDFTTHNKPCLYLNYNPSQNSDWSTDIIYNFQHFRSMIGLDAVGWINNKEAIKEVVLKTLKDSREVTPDKIEWMKKVVLHPVDKSSIKIAKAIV